jgi:hypothetical protein
MKINLDEIGVKDLFMIGGLITVLSGFYYTTDARIASLESSMEYHTEDSSKVAILEERIANMDRKIDFIYDVILASANKETLIIPSDAGL